MSAKNDKNIFFGLNYTNLFRGPLFIWTRRTEVQAVQNSHGVRHTWHRQVPCQGRACRGRHREWLPYSRDVYCWRGPMPRALWTLALPSRTLASHWDDDSAASRTSHLCHSNRIFTLTTSSSWNEMKVQWFKVHSEADQESAYSNTLTSTAAEQSKIVRWSKSPCNQSGSKGKGLWKKRFAEEPGVEFRMKYWASKRRCKWW